MTSIMEAPAVDVVDAGADEAVNVTASAVDAGEATDASPKHRIQVFSYGVHYKWVQRKYKDGAGENMPDVVFDQLRSAHDVREDLVTIQHDYEQALKDIWSSYPQVAQAEEDLAAAEEAARAAVDTLNDLKVKQRTKTPKGADVDAAKAALKDARARAKDLRVQRREAISVVKSEADEKIKAANDERIAREKDLYRIYAQEGDLYHATLGDVRDAHKVAVQRVKKDRASGKATALRHHRFDGQGRIVVGLLRQAGMPQRTPAVIADPNGKYRNVLHIPGWVDPAEWDTLTRSQQRQRGRVIARMRVGGAGELGDSEVIDIPIQIDRMIPADADITGARLVLRKVGSRQVATLNVTARLPLPQPVTDGPTVALHLGWRSEGDGAVRVATWRATSPLDMSVDMREVMGANRDRTAGQIVLQSRIFDRDARLAYAQSARDDAMNAAKDSLVAWLEEHGPVPHPTWVNRETGEMEMLLPHRVAAWRRADRLALLAMKWRDEHPVAPDGTVGTDIAILLEEWRRLDKTMWDGHAGGTRRLANHRKDVYSQIAAVLGFDAGRVIVDDTSLTDIARTHSDADDLPNDVVKRIAHQRAFAAPGMLRERVKITCAREGVDVVTVPAKNLSRECADCGHVNDDVSGHEVVCAGCSRKYDVDQNATLLMLRRATVAAQP